MVTRTEQRMAGLCAFVTAVLFAAGLVLFGGGPPARHGGVVRAWFTDNAAEVRLSALVWLAASIVLVIFAVAVREASWTRLLDRPWVGLLFVQGAVGFAAVAVVASSVLWTLADQASAGAISSDLAGTLWAVAWTLLRFATWGLAVPLIIVGLILYRYSTLGQFATVTSFMVAGGLLVPVTWAPSLYAFCAWLVLAAVTFVRPLRHRRVPEPASVS